MYSWMQKQGARATPTTQYESWVFDDSESRPVLERTVHNLLRGVV